MGEGPGAFLLRGAFDRLDVRAPGGEGPEAKRPAILIDYKTGSTGSEDASKAMRALEDLQLPLYARAVERLRDVRVVGLEHYTATRRERFVVGDKAFAPALDLRAEGGRAKTVSEAAFQAFLDRAAQVASSVVTAIRRGPAGGAAGGHQKLPLDGVTCERCAVAAVCRPDVLRFPAVRAPTPSPLDDDPLGDGGGDGGDRGNGADA